MFHVSLPWERTVTLQNKRRTGKRRVRDREKEESEKKTKKNGGMFRFCASQTPARTYVVASEGSEPAHDHLLAAHALDGQEEADEARDDEVVVLAEAVVDVHLLNDVHPLVKGDGARQAIAEIEYSSPRPAKFLSSRCLVRPRNLLLHPRSLRIRGLPTWTNLLSACEPVFR